jgi:preprotein translocase subunit SecG
MEDFTMRKSLTKAIAVLVCLVFTISLVPAMYAAEKKVSKDDRLLLQKPMSLLVSLFPFLGSALGNSSKAISSSNISGKKTLKPTAEIIFPTKPANERD